MIDEMNATIGIDLVAADDEQLKKRAFEFCGEMAECYEEGSLENIAFQALQQVFIKLSGGVFCGN